MRYLQILTAVAATLALLPGYAHAQTASDYPTKPVRVIVGSATGGSADQTARLVGQSSNELWTLALMPSAVLPNNSGK